MTSARRLLPVVPLLVAVVLLASCSTTTRSDASTGSDASTTASAPTSSTASSTTTPTVPAPVINASPALGSTNLNPVTGLTIGVAGGTITDLTLTNPDGKVVAGALNADNTVWTLGEELGYGKTYTVAGHSTNSAGTQFPITGIYTTVAPGDTVRTMISPGDGKVVGVAAPVIVSFGVEPADRAAVEKAVSITTTPAIEGAWAWIEHADGQWALDYRPKSYWPSGTVVHVEAKMYGVDFGNGNWGRQDVTSDFTIGRNQVVLADVNSHDMIVQRDGVTVATYPASYGKGTTRGTTTRSGIHVATEFYETKFMTNEKYGYVNLEEHWAVRISNNGEFIHANPGTVGSQGSTNVSHGCVNLSDANAKAYMKSAIYGDPVEVTGTDVQLSAEDGDLYDWAVPWEKWVTMSGKNAA